MTPKVLYTCRDLTVFTDSTVLSQMRLFWHCRSAKLRIRFELTSDGDTIFTYELVWFTSQLDGIYVDAKKGFLYFRFLSRPEAIWSERKNIAIEKEVAKELDIEEQAVEEEQSDEELEDWEKEVHDDDCGPREDFEEIEMRRKLTKTLMANKI
jgi:hypothetical protein